METITTEKDLKPNTDPETDLKPNTNLEIDKLINKIKAVDKYIKKSKKCNPEFIYDNPTEYQELLTGYESYKGELKQEDLQSFSFIVGDYLASKEERTNERTPEQNDFYNKIVGINTYIFETKERESNWLYDNVDEANNLLDEFERLKMNDPNTLTVMQDIVKDIKVLLERSDLDKATIFFDRLRGLGIEQSLEQENPQIAF